MHCETFSKVRSLTAMEQTQRTQRILPCSIKVCNQQQPAQQSAKDKAQQELRNHLAEPYDESFGGQPIKWICSLAAKYPVVVDFARAVSTIPASQNSNERVFSVAGVCP